MSQTRNINNGNAHTNNNASINMNPQEAKIADKKKFEKNMEQIIEHEKIIAQMQYNIDYLEFLNDGLPTNNSNSENSEFHFTSPLQLKQKMTNDEFIRTLEDLIEQHTAQRKKETNIEQDRIKTIFESFK